MAPNGKDEGTQKWWCISTKSSIMPAIVYLYSIGIRAGGREQREHGGHLWKIKPVNFRCWK